VFKSYASYVRPSYAWIFKILFAIDTCSTSSCHVLHACRTRFLVLVFSTITRCVFGELLVLIYPSIHPFSHPREVEYLLLYNRILLSAVRRTLVVRIASIAARVACRYLVFRLSLETSSRFWTGRGSVLDIIVKIENKVVFRDVMCHP